MADSLFKGLDMHFVNIGINMEGTIVNAEINGFDSI